jgi:hypothetical protein
VPHLVALLGWVTTWPALAEVCHLFKRRIGMEPAVYLMADAA